jgi:hypothetical protein
MFHLLVIVKQTNQSIMLFDLAVICLFLQIFVTRLSPKITGDEMGDENGVSVFFNSILYFNSFALIFLNFKKGIGTVFKFGVIVGFKF